MNLCVALSGNITYICFVIKKIQKTPKEEIEKAIKIKQEYENEKK